MSEAKVASIINCDSPEQADVVLLAVPYDGTSSFGKGADGGPDAIKYCLDRQIELEDQQTGLSPTDHLKVAWRRLCLYKLADPNDPVPSVAMSPEEVKEAVAATFGYHFGMMPRIEPPFIIIVGGEHSVSIGAFQALKKFRDPHEVTIVQIDAHLDLRDDDSDFADEPHGSLAHCCVMRWAEKLFFRLVNVGARSYSGKEWNLAGELERAGQMSCFPLDESVATMPDIEMILEAIKTPKVYLTIDVDGIDPGQMPATGTPVQGGLEWWYTRELVRRLFEEKKVIGADVVEVAVTHDPKTMDPAERLTASGAAQLIHDMIACHDFYRK